MLDGSGAIIRCAGSTSSRLEPHIDIELGSYLGLLLIHHLCSSSVLFCSCLGYREKGGVPFLWFLCCAGIGQLGFWGEVHQFSQVSPFRGISSLIFISTAPQGDSTLWGCLEPSNQRQKSNLDLLTDSLSLSCHYLNADIIADMINPTGVCCVFQTVWAQFLWWLSAGCKQPGRHG